MQPEKKIHSGLTEYRLNMILHRLEGPAIEYHNSFFGCSFYINGSFIKFRDQYKPILLLRNYIRIKHAA